MTATSSGLMRIGTRGSRLAQWQADAVASRLAARTPSIETSRVIVKTAGDRILDTPLSKIGDKGLFTKELDTALLRGEIDIAVHSLKDLPTHLPDGLAIGAVLEREDPRDVLIAPSGHGLADLPRGARVGTSSLRRRSQILALRHDLEVLDLRGNVPTRIEKAERGEYDAIVLARAGVSRLGLMGKVTEEIDPSVILPAVGQGAIAVEVRAQDQRALLALEPLEHAPTRLAVAAERALLRRLEGGCQVPIGALGRFTGTRLDLDGLVADLEGQSLVRAHEEADVRSVSEAEALGERLAERLLALGAREVLERILAEARPVRVPAPSGDGP